MTAAKIDIYFTSQFDTPSIGTVDGDLAISNQRREKNHLAF